MPSDPRINALMYHVEAMIAALESFSEEAREQASRENSPAADPHLTAFLYDLDQRARALKDLLEEDVINHLIGLNNLLGPVQHLLESDRHSKSA